MRKFLLAFLFLALPVLAQAPPEPAPQSNVGFWAMGLTGWIAASTTTANIALSVQAPQIQVFNTSTGIAYVNWGNTSAVTASAGSAGTSTSNYPVAPGSVVVISVPIGTNYVAAILSTSSGAVLVTPGQGL